MTSSLAIAHMLTKLLALSDLNAGSLGRPPRRG
jgi:hypothetical protein